MHLEMGSSVLLAKFNARYFDQNLEQLSSDQRINSLLTTTVNAGGALDVKVKRDINIEAGEDKFKGKVSLLVEGKQDQKFDPATTQKRLGDGYYEQKLIREQVAQLTGRRFLGDYSSDQAQYQALMDNALTTAKTLNLRPGIALSAEQMALLTSDIVWLVEQSVTLADGSVQKVLAPPLRMAAM